jgi:hypothetical protein
MTAGKIVTSVRESFAVASNIIESAKNEIVWIVPPAPLVMGRYFSLSDQSRAFIANGGSLRGILNITPPYIELARNLMDTGETLRHVEGYSGLFFIVGDVMETMSAVIVNPEELSCASKVIAFWGNGTTYAEYLLSIFEKGGRKALMHKSGSMSYFERNMPALSGRE